MAAITASVHSPWRASRTLGLNAALLNALWTRLGLPMLAALCRA